MENEQKITGFWFNSWLILTLNLSSGVLNDNLVKLEESLYQDK